MSSMKKIKEGINLKKLLRLKNTGSIFVIAGLLTIFVIALYTFILQSSYTKTALETEITRDTASADACLLYTSPSPRDGLLSRIPSSA